MTKKTRLLLLLFYHSLVSVQSLLAVDNSERSTYQTLKKLRQAQYIKPHQLTYKVNGRPIKENSYVITLEGIRALKREKDLPRAYYPELIQALEIPTSLNIVGSGNSHQRLSEYLGKSRASVFSALMGARFSPLYLYKGAEIPNSLGSLVSEAAGKLADPEPDLQPQSPYRFVSYDHILEELIKRGLYDAQYRLGREVGIIKSSNRSLLLYAGSERGLGWSKWHLKCELPAYYKYMEEVANKSLNREAYAAILFPSPKIFSDIFTDKRSKRKESGKLGDHIDKLYAFPESQAGIANAKDWLDYGEGLTESLISAAIEQGAYEKNDKRLFPLKLRGQDVYISPYLSYSDLEELKGISSPFRILCQPWQEAYYRRIMPDKAYDHLYI
ncbi:hypothetical protein ACKQTC_07165 [Peptococcus simiae]|uniref:Uncharacterized protein n=1 Tax=Peptococcus simiae TaxID=1643805 RepID=A0ABW9GZV4_9FIRM